MLRAITLKFALKIRLKPELIDRSASLGECADAPA
jgi:hypothetical protein